MTMTMGAEVVMDIIDARLHHCMAGRGFRAIFTGT
jgi:hypothetical protein